MNYEGYSCLGDKLNYITSCLAAVMQQWLWNRWDGAQICVEMIGPLHPHQIWCPMDLGGKLLHISPNSRLLVCQSFFGGRFGEDLRNVALMKTSGVVH